MNKKEKYLINGRQYTFEIIEEHAGVKIGYSKKLRTKSRDI